jgi:lambda family phage portal protein
MALLDHIGRGLDRLVGLFSPAREVRRAQARLRAAHLRYAAAQVDPYTKGWVPVDQNVNELISQASPLVRARVRQLVRDFPIFARAVEAATTICVGRGFQLQARIKRPDGTSAEDLNQQIEEAWAHSCEEMDAAGLLNLHEMARLARRQEIEAGEFLGVKILDRGGDRLVPFAVQMHEPEWLTDYSVKPRRGNRVVAGVEVNEKTGWVVAYWLEDPQNLGKPLRVDRADVIHGFEVLRPGQLRGISPLAPAVQIAKDLDEYIGSEVEAAQMASRWLAKAKTPNPARFHQDRVPDRTEPRVRTQEIGNNIIEVLYDSEDFELFSHNRPNQQFESFVAFVIRLIAGCVGLTPEIISGDYRGINYSNLKGIRLDLAMNARPAQRRLIRNFYQPIFEGWLDAAVAAGVVRLPDYWRRRREYQRAVQWLPPGLESADILRDTKALLDKMRGGLLSPQEYLMSEGRDPRETLLATREFLKMAEELGVPLDWSRTPLKQNPAALGAKE